MEQPNKTVGTMDKKEDETVPLEETSEQTSEDMDEPTINLGADQMPEDYNAEEFDQFWYNLEDEGDPENLEQSATTPVQIPISQGSNENRDAEKIQVDESVKATVPPKENPEKDEPIASTSASCGYACQAIKVKDVDVISDAIPSTSRQVPSVSKCMGKKGMSDEPKETQVVKQEVGVQSRHGREAKKPERYGIPVVDYDDDEGVDCGDDGGKGDSGSESSDEFE